MYYVTLTITIIAIVMHEKMQRLMLIKLIQQSQTHFSKSWYGLVFPAIGLLAWMWKEKKNLILRSGTYVTT